MSVPSYLPGVNMTHPVPQDIPSRTSIVHIAIIGIGMFSWIYQIGLSSANMVGYQATYRSPDSAI